jgi:hypothetical protein
MPDKDQWDALKKWLNQNSHLSNNPANTSGSAEADQQEVVRKQACAELESKLGNTRLIHEEGFSDGYGQLKSSYSKSEEIILYRDGRYIQKWISISGFGSAGSGFTEKKKSGKWTTWCHVSRELQLQGFSLSLIDEEEVYDNRPVKLEKGSVVFGNKRYAWSAL